MRLRLSILARLLAAAGAVAAPHRTSAQQPVRRDDAVAAALARGPRIAFARADSATAAASVVSARQFENPTFATSYSKSAPQLHYSLDLPLDYPWLRRTRLGAAIAGLSAARNRFLFEREATVFEIDTAYTRALAAARRAELSRRSARDADSVVTLARLRRDAGDGSELDVELALISAGQQANATAIDSLETISALLTVQGLMGLPSGEVTIRLADTLDLGGPLPSAVAGSPLMVAAAEDEVKAADQGLELARRMMFGAPSISLGFDARDPSEPGLLPVLGISLPLPVFNQNGGGIALALAQRDRAQAALALARLEGASQFARAQREALVARERAERSRRLVEGANRVAALSLLAYREGAASLSSVLEAQRLVREALSQHVSDLAAARNATGLARLITLTVNGSRK